MGTESAPLQTRNSLVEAAIHLFGHRGFGQTSTRELAARAGTNIASIAYHFGGKAGLHAASAREVAARIGAVLGSPENISPTNPTEAAAQLEAMLRRFVAFLVAAPEAPDIAAFMLRELTDPGEVADLIYAEFLEPRHRMLCQLWGVATGRSPESEEVKLAVFAMLGQVLYFRIGQPYVLRRIGWAGIGPDEAGRIADLLSANLHAMIERHRT
ncbi:CerR family C-terminal domain-containing protein [Rhodovulum marinum]|uniref:TetR family transcriptional regulator n=1 Tax=Rhodovulum marinum TaxID=320662 RepID=A0A4V6NR38_9RHOB|nr:CerR family C-terminal domain-containing protein [Rhodovulum marinum]TCP44366.1 TetR family transcriptional regulator [Rhodovulum marinum]